MQRTQIQLGESEYEALRELAHRENRSMADCVREAIAAYLHRAQPIDELLSIAGTFAPDPTDAVKAHDRWWAESILSGKQA